MLVIVAAGACHATAMAAVHASAFPPAERWDAAAITAQFALPGVFGAVHAAGGMVLARTIAGEAEVLTLAVATPVQGRGIGRLLLQDALATAWARGAEAMFLEVAETNVAARALYDRAGFVPVGRRPRYYDGGVDALILRARP